MKKKFLLCLLLPCLLGGCSISDSPASSSVISEVVPNEPISSVESSDASSDDSLPLEGWKSIGEEIYPKLEAIMERAGGPDALPFMDIPAEDGWSYDYASTGSYFGLVAETGKNRNKNAMLIATYKEKLASAGLQNPTQKELKKYESQYYDTFFNSDVPENFFLIGDSGLILEVADIVSTEFPEYYAPKDQSGNDYTEGIILSIQVIKTF